MTKRKRHSKRLKADDAKVVENEMEESVQKLLCCFQNSNSPNDPTQNRYALCTCDRWTFSNGVICGVCDLPKQGYLKSPKTHAVVPFDPRDRSMIDDAERGDYSVTFVKEDGHYYEPGFEASDWYELFSNEEYRRKAPREQCRGRYVYQCCSSLRVLQRTIDMKRQIVFSQTFDGCTILMNMIKFIAGFDHREVDACLRLVMPYSDVWKQDPFKRSVFFYMYEWIDYLERHEVVYQRYQMEKDKNKPYECCFSRLPDDVPYFLESLTIRSASPIYALWSEESYGSRSLLGMPVQDYYLYRFRISQQFAATFWELMNTEYIKVLMDMIVTMPFDIASMISSYLCAKRCFVPCKFESLLNLF